MGLVFDKKSLTVSVDGSGNLSGSLSNCEGIVFGGRFRGFTGSTPEIDAELKDANGRNIAGNYTGNHDFASKQFKWIGGYNFQTILRMIRDETPAEGVVMWSHADNITDRQRAKDAQYLQRMILRTTIPHPFVWSGTTP